MSRRKYLLLFLALLSAVLLAIWQFGYHGVDPRLIVWPPPVDEAPAELGELVDLDVNEMPLDEVLALLSKRHGVQFDLDVQALANVGVGPDTPVKRHVAGIPMRSVLRLVLKDLDLVCGHRNGKILVTTPEEWENPTYFVAKVYTLEALLASPYAVDERQVAAVVTGTVAPTTWDAAGGAGAIRPIPGALVVSQHPDVQKEVGWLLAQLADAASDPLDFVPRDVTPPPSALEKRIIKVLAETTSLDAVERPLADVIGDLALRHKIPIQLDTKALDGVGVSSDTPITRRLSGISLRSALRLLLKDLDLTFMVRGDVLQITTTEISDNSLVTRIYPIGDLLDRGKSIDPDALIDGITVIVQPTTWDDAGGAGGIDYCAGCLVISQTPDVHELAEYFLENTRRALRPVSLAGPENNINSQQSRQEQQVQAALAKPITLKFTQTPLFEVVAELQRLLEIEVEIDTKALDGVGVSSDTPVTIDVEDIPLISVLGQLLYPLDLTFMVRDDVLQITSPEIADNSLVPVWYRLQSLVNGPWPGGERVWPGELVRIIATTIAPTTWSAAGGAGEMLVLGNVLIVNQTQDVQRSVSDLLAALAEFQFRRTSGSPYRVSPPIMPQRVAALEAALSKTADLDYAGLTLGAAAKDLSVRYGVPVKLDTKALDGVGVVESDQVSLWAKAVPLSLAIELLHGRGTLAYDVKFHSLWITTPEMPDYSLDTRLYDVRDLATGAKTSPRDFVELVTCLVAPTTWDDAGGAGSIKPLPGMLVVTQTLAVHRQLERFLDLLRQTRGKRKTLLGRLPEVQDENDPGVAASLAASVSIAVKNSPLDEALRKLFAKSDLGIVLDRGVLEGKMPEVSYSASEVSLATALDGLLEQACLSYCVREATVVATSYEFVVDSPVLRLYPVHDLLPFTEQRLSAQQAAELRLEEAAAGSHPRQWAAEFLPADTRSPLVAAIALSVGNEGGLVGVSLWEEWLVVLADRAAQRDVEVLLSLARDIAFQRTAPLLPAAHPFAPVGIYDLRPLLTAYPELDERQLAEWVAGQLDADVWSPRWERPLIYGGALTRTWIATLPGALVLHPIPSEHARVVRCLEFLLTGAADLPRPCELSRDDCQAALVRLTDHIRQETDELRLGYALWLVTFVERPTPELVAAVVEKLAQTDLTEIRRGQGALLAAVAQCGPAAKRALPLLRSKYTGTASDRHRWQRLKTLAALGPEGRLEVLRELALSGQPPGAFDVIGQFPDDPESLPTVVGWLDNTAYANDSVLNVLRLIDPRGRGTRRILDEWDADPDPDVRLRAKWVRPMIDNQPPPLGGYNRGGGFF